MTFKVTKHGSSSPPPNALELLGELIAGRREEAFFKRATGHISARIDTDDGIGRNRSEETEIARLKVLEIIGEVCERTPGLKLDWYAVRPAG